MDKMGTKNRWDLTIFADAPVGNASLAVGDLDGDGRLEVVTAGDCGITWIRPGSFEHGVIGLAGAVAPGGFHCGAALYDLDGDGRQELVVGNCEPSTHLLLYKSRPDLAELWDACVIDAALTGGAHDLLFADVDGDGRPELICNAMYTDTPGLFLYKPGPDLKAPWRKHAVHEFLNLEGTDAADVDGDGLLEIVSGPYLFHSPPGGPFSGVWERRELIGYRDFCRAAFVDITGNGRPDLVLAESEYPDGRLCWLENRLRESPASPWLKHDLDTPLYYCHSLSAWRDAGSGSATIFCGEMEMGGWETVWNHDARLLLYTTRDDGANWLREEIYRGAGTHNAQAADLDGDGEREIAGKPLKHQVLQIWKRSADPGPCDGYEHVFVDRAKPYTGTDIIAVDVDGDGLEDIVCGSWWYKNPTWERRDIPGAYQIINAYDLDGDGRRELIGLKRIDGLDWYHCLSSKVAWFKPTDPERGLWEEHYIGEGSGDWPHGSAIGLFLPGGGLALALGYHNADSGGNNPELFIIPSDPRQSPWPRKILAKAPYGEEMLACDLDGDGRLDVVGAGYLMTNNGDGTFDAVKMTAGEERYQGARVRAADLNGDGRLEVLAVVEDLSYETRESFYRPVAWFEQPSSLRQSPWEMHVIDLVKCPHSLEVADLDGDGELEIIVGEHDPFRSERSRSRLLVYKKAEPGGRAWRRYVLDDRFEHHDGTKLINLGGGRLGIMSHGWGERQFVHLWAPPG